MMEKCEFCKSDLKMLFTSLYCPNDCDENKALEEQTKYLIESQRSYHTIEAENALVEFFKDCVVQDKIKQPLIINELVEVKPMELPTSLSLFSNYKTEFMDDDGVDLEELTEWFDEVMGEAMH